MYETLVEESVRCAKYLKKRKCRPEQCKTCPVGLRVARCMNSLDDWGQLEVASMSRKALECEESKRVYKNPGSWITKLVGLIFMFIGLSIFGRGCSAYAYSYYDYYVNDSAIRNTLRSTFRKVHDRDGDGIVNCIDYTLTFKQEWDKSNPPNFCEIVRNYHAGKTKGTSMNHLFIRVKMSMGGNWLYIEPQAMYNGYNYKMDDYWGWPKYNPKYNIYGETFMWMHECIR